MATLKESADAFVAKLSDLFGLVENDLQVLPVRGSKQGPKTVGYYSKMSQFRSRCRVYVNVTYIESCYMHSSDADEEVRKTIAFGYAASMLEAIEHLAKEGDPMVVPDWKVAFDGDTNLFAEDFARLCVTFDACQETFWERFMLNYAREYRRVFAVSDSD